MNGELVMGLTHTITHPQPHPIPKFYEWDGTEMGNGNSLFSLLLQEVEYDRPITKSLLFFREYFSFLVYF